MAASEPDFWDDQDKAQAAMRAITKLRSEVSVWEKLRKHLDDTIELAALEDETLQDDLSKELARWRMRLVSLSSAHCLPVDMMMRMPLLRFMQEPVALQPKIGQRCSCECIRAGLNRTGTTSTSLTLAAAMKLV